MTRADTNTQRQGSAPPDRAWLAEGLAEARAVLADVAHHSDHLIGLACKVLARHGESEAERREARALLFVIDARCPGRYRHAQRSDPEMPS